MIYADGMVPEYKKITALVAGETLTLPDDDIQLGVASTKNVEGTVTITGGGSTEQFASISFRLDINGGDMIEITSVDVLNAQGYEIDLPEGSYSVVAWAPDFDTKTSDLEILETDTSPIMNNIDFP